MPRRQLAAARRLIRRVRIAVRGPRTGYDRDEFGSAWSDIAINVPWAGNGCSTRDDILGRDLVRITVRPDTDGCVIETGRLRDPYVPSVIRFEKTSAALVQIDHVIALSLAWQMGAATWTAGKRKQLANDPLNLLAVDGPTNGSKGDDGPADWLPPNARIRCAYSVRVAQVARKYDLPVTASDKTTLLRQCRTTVP